MSTLLHFSSILVSLINYSWCKKLIEEIDFPKAFKTLPSSNLPQPAVSMRVGQLLAVIIKSQYNLPCNERDEYFKNSRAKGSIEILSEELKKYAGRVPPFFEPKHEESPMEYWKRMATVNGAKLLAVSSPSNSVLLS